MSRILYGASEIPEITSVVMRVRHVNDQGIKGTYIFRDVKGIEDLSARIQIIKDSAPDLKWELHFIHGKEVAWLISSKR